MASGILGMDTQIANIIYDMFFTKYDLPQDIKAVLTEHRNQVEALYASIEGQWWQIGWRKIYKLENWFGKARYELGQEGKAFAIIQEDLALVGAWIHMQPSKGESICPATTK